MARSPLAPLVLALGLTLTASALTACDDFAPPSELTQWQVVGVIAEPPVVALGDRTVLTPLIATPSGPLTSLPMTSASWQMTQTLPGVPPFGEVTARPDGSAEYRAPMTLPRLPPNALPQDSVQLGLDLDGKSTTIIKTVLVSDQPVANPVISALTADGVPVTERVTVAAGAAIALAVTTAPAATETSRYAWYSSLGTIEDYQSNPCTLTAKSAGTGWLYVVVRDGQHGVVWRAVPITVR